MGCRMSHRCARLCCVALLALTSAPDLFATDYLELQNFRLIDGTGAPERLVQRLVARDGTIVAIDQEGEMPAAGATATWTRIGLDGAWVMPGLIDTHVHVARFPDAHAQAESILLRAVRGGVTGVRDLAGDARALAELERAGGRQEIIVPHLVFSAVFGGPDIFRDGPLAEIASGRVAGTAPWARVVTGASDLRQLIAEARGSGATNIKVYGDLVPALARRLIREADRQGMLTTAHATVFPARPGDLVSAGIGSLSHAPYLVWEAVDSVPDDYRQRIAGPWDSIAPDHPRLLALYRHMAERGVTLDATLYVYKSMQSYPGVPKMDWTEAAFAWGARATRFAHEAGVRVTTGTDWFEPRDDFELPHTHEELALLVDTAGFTPMQALVAATSNGAYALGREKTHGTVEIGKVADLVVLDADPLADIRNTTRIRFTLRQGTLVRPE
jgi:imidazolonepropionase-like amidohydrolase